MKLNTNVKLLRFGHCYINKNGDVIIGLISGNKRRGYKFIARSIHPTLYLDQIWIQTRIVPNDGSWTEISLDKYCAISMFYYELIMRGEKTKPALTGGPVEFIKA